MQVPASSSPPSSLFFLSFLLVVPLNPVSKQVIPCGIRSLKSNVFPPNVKGVLDVSTAELVRPPDIPPSALRKIPACLTNLATGFPQVVRLVKSVQLRRRGTSVKYMVADPVGTNWSVKSPLEDGGIKNGPCGKDSKSDTQMR